MIVLVDHVTASLVGSREPVENGTVQTGVDRDAGAPDGRETRRTR